MENEGSFKDVVFYEVEIADNDFTDYVEEGETWCFDSLTSKVGGDPPPGGGGTGGGGGGGVGNTPPAGVASAMISLAWERLSVIFNFKTARRAKWSTLLTTSVAKKQVGWF